MGYSYHWKRYGDGGVDHCAGEPRGHHPFAKCPTELWSWVTLYVANVVALLAAFLVVAILWFLRMLCKGRSRDIYSLSRYDVFSKVGGAVLSAFGLPFLMPILVLGAPLLVLFVSIRRWLLHRGVRIPSYVLSRDRHQFHRVSNNLDAGDVEMAATVNLPWSRRGWLVMLRDREREPVGLSDKEARLRTFMTRLRKNSERPSVVLGCEDDSFFSAVWLPTMQGRLRRLVVEVIKLEQDHLFREIVTWL